MTDPVVCGVAPWCQQSPLFRAGTEGYFTYRIPALVVTNQGTVLAFAEARRHSGADDGEIHLVLRRSRDAGSTWEPMQVLFRDGERSVNQPAPVVDRQTGAVLLVHCRDNRQVLVSRSDDDGLTWSIPAEITRSVVSPAWAYVGTGPGHGIQLSRGRLLVPAWGDLTPGAFATRQDHEIVQFSLVLRSDDHGRTWHRSACLDLNRSDECMVVETASGAVYLDGRSRQDRRCRAFAWSHDGGASWSPVANDERLAEPSCQGSILRCGPAAPGEPDAILMAHPGSRQRRECLTLRLSRDGGASWPVARLLTAGYSGYSDLTLAPDGTVCCLYETAECRQLTLARFSMAWLMAGRQGG